MSFSSSGSKLQLAACSIHFSGIKVSSACEGNSPRTWIWYLLFSSPAKLAISSTHSWVRIPGGGGWFAGSYLLREGWSVEGGDVNGLPLRSILVEGVVEGA